MTTEDLSPAERRVSEFLSGLAADAPVAGSQLSAAVVRTARWQRAARTPLRAAGSLAAAVADGVTMMLGLRRGGGAGR